jgi:Tfp pilus assembly protein PilF
VVKVIRNWRRGAAALALSAACASGCVSLPTKEEAPSLAPRPVLSEPTAKLGPHEAANVKVELARVLEKRGDAAAAMNAYLDAHAQDPANIDAPLGVARLLDAQGRFAEAMKYYKKADAIQPTSTQVACNYGYSLYLQGRHAEAEAALRQALAREPENAPAHSNLGMVLARTGRRGEAVAEFRRAGVSDADAHVNVAFALTLEKAFPQARAQYEKALTLDPSSAAAREGLRNLEVVVTKLAQADAAKEATAE